MRAFLTLLSTLSRRTITVFANLHNWLRSENSNPLWSTLSVQTQYISDLLLKVDDPEPSRLLWSLSRFSPPILPFSSAGCGRLHSSIRVIFWCPSCWSLSCNSLLGMECLSRHVQLWWHYGCMKLWRVVSLHTPFDLLLIPSKFYTMSVRFLLYKTFLLAREFAWVSFRASFFFWNHFFGGIIWLKVSLVQDSL